MASATFPLPPMKLLQVFFVGRAEGGGHAHARSLEGGLKRRGIEARCVCVLRSPDTPADGWTTLVRTASPWPLVVPLALLKTFALIRAERPDAVISHTPAASLLVHPIGWLCGVKERVSIHHAPLTRWSRFSRLLRLLDLVYGSSGLTTSTVMVGEMGVRDVSRFPASYRRRVSLIHNEVSPPAVESPVSRTEFGVDSERLLLAFVGRRTIAKGADLAARLLISGIVMPTPAGHVTIRAGSLGTFYMAPKPGAKPYVEIGQRVQPDTDVCVIEVMKLFTSVQAGVTGVVRQVLVKDAELVEFDQPLFLIEVTE